MPTFITNPAQFGPPPKPKVVPVGDVEGLTDAKGDYARVFARKLTVPQYAHYQDSLVDDNGQATRATNKYHNCKYVAEVISDAEGNPLWQTAEEAITFFRPYPQSVLDELFVAAVNANRADKAAVDRAEKNSEGTPSS